MNRIPEKYFLELLIVLGVIPILIIVMFPRFHKVQLRAKVAQAKKDLGQITQAMQAYNADQEGYGLQPVFILGKNSKRASADFNDFMARFHSAIISSCLIELKSLLPQQILEKPIHVA